MERHWSLTVAETTFSFSPTLTAGSCPISIVGGSENGQFCLIGEQVRHDRLIYHSGPTTKLQTYDLVLEVQGQKVAGYTSHDLEEWISTVAQNSVPVLIKTAKAGTLNKELRPYLNSGFPKGSIDHDTQMTIRENLFQRTVPCTTRPPREGETNGVDYTFVTIEQFHELERSGNLLESGEFDGNFYGMPKPPKASSLLNSKPNTDDVRPGAHPSSKGKRQRNRSTIEATSNKNHPIDDTVHSAHIPGTSMVVMSPGRSNSKTAVDQSRPSIPSPPTPSKPRPPPPEMYDKDDADLGELPPNWEAAFTPDGHMYFIDHTTETTHWLDPRLPENVRSSNNDISIQENLPYGWEKVNDPHYGTYYIDHLNKKTQYDPPTHSSVSKYQDLHSPASAQSGKSNPSLWEINSVSQVNSKPFFTNNPDELSGEILRTSLIKSPRGFGFTIVGGEERDEEFLQIKNVVPHGPADQDGVLATGDVLVQVNDELVLGFTHSDVVSLFQAIKPGERVNLEICRGYPLAFDPNDPNTEIVTTVAVSMPKLTAAEAKRREAERAAFGKIDDDDDDDTESLQNFANSLLQEPINSMPPSQPPKPQQNASANLSPHMYSIEIVRGQNGFGFTIADSIHGQKVKHILDPGRCKTLQEGDILVKIAGKDVRHLNHMDVVQVLKGCEQGKPTELVVQRGALKKSPRKPSQSLVLEDDHNQVTSEKFDKPASVSPAPPSSSALPVSPAQMPSAERLMSQPDSEKDSFNYPARPPEQLNLSTSVKTSQDIQGDADDDSDEEPHTPPPLPSKGRLNSDTTVDSKENILSSPTTSIPTVSAVTTNMPSGHLKDSTNLVTDKNNDNFMPGNRPSSFSHGMLPSQHPVMNQYSPYYQPQKESFYDTPNKFRSDSALTAQQRFDMMSSKPEVSQNHQFGNMYNPPTKSHPQVLPNVSTSSMHNQNQPLDRRSRTPGPEHMRSPPERHHDDRFRSKTPNPGDHRQKAHNLQNNLNQPSRGMPVQPFSSIPPFEEPSPMSSNQNTPGQWATIDVNLRRGEQGFGFRIIGGPEEGTQVAIGHIVPGGAADVDSRLRTGDEIIRVDGQQTLGESHHKVVALMGQASSNGYVNLGVRRRLTATPDNQLVKRPLMQSSSANSQTYDVFVTRRESEGFGFIIVSSVSRIGAVIGRIIEGSPAERCGKLRVGDRILAVNGIDISNMLHEDIVNLIKDSGFSVKLAVAPPVVADQPPNNSMVNTTALPALGESETLIRSMQSHTTSGTADRYVGGGGSSAPNQRPFSNFSMPPNGGGTPSEPHPFNGNFRSQSRSQVDNTHTSPSAVNDITRPPSSGYDPSRVGVRMPLAGGHLQQSATSVPHVEKVQTPQGNIFGIELMKGSRGFGFSIRGGREFNNMPLYVLRIAEDGAAYVDKRLHVGDEILEINNRSTHGMSHADAINLIQSGGAHVRLLVKRTGHLPVNLSEVGLPSPQGSGMSSPAIRNQPPHSSASALPHRIPDRGFDNPSPLKARPDKYNPTSKVEPLDNQQPYVGYQAESGRAPGYHKDRYSPAPNQDLANQQRGYPAGRDGNQPDRLYNAVNYQQQPDYNKHRAPSNTFNQNSAYLPPQPQQYRPPSQPLYAGKVATPDIVRRNNPQVVHNNSYQPSNDGQGSYNAGAMNRQINQQMYNYYDNGIQRNGQERQPPIGQNSYEARPTQPTYPSTYNNRYNNPASYKQMDYGQHGMLNRMPNPAYPRYNDTVNGSARIAPNQSGVRGGYNPSIPTNSQYTRQPTYQ